jgi:RNA polymerase sigma factor for flagellar operon FliA
VGAQQLTVDHLRLAASIARSMSKQLPRHLDPQDLEQDARLGLMDAALKFDARRNAAFGTNARRRIRGAIIDGLRRTDHLSRDERTSIKAEGADAPAGALHPKTADEIPGVLVAPDRYAVEAERDRLLHDAICTLPARWRIVIRAYYHGGKTMREIGLGLGVNESRVSNIRARALRRLRQRLEAQGLTASAQFVIREVRP